MSIFDEITSQMKDALKSKDSLRLSALRNIRASFLHEMKKDNSKELADEICVQILRRLEKQRKESIAAFEQGGRDEQAAAERSELSIVQEFLPSLADEETTRAWVKEAVEAVGASSPKDIGSVMGKLMGSHKGEVDGALANRILRQVLAE
jgi:uncharacterized protein YqeY